MRDCPFFGCDRILFRRTDYVHSALDPTRRSGRGVTDGREPDQSRQLPDSGRWPDCVGIQIQPEFATEFPEIPHGFHTNGP